MRMELLLFWRVRLAWPLAGFTVAWGVLLVGGPIRGNVSYAWYSLCFSSFILALVLSLVTGNQIVRDHEQRVAGVVWSTPVAAGAYVWGKYMAALLPLLGLAVLLPVTAVMTDAILKGAWPAIGPWPYVLSLPWLLAPTLVFGSALALAAATLARGRLASILAVLLFWLLPLIASNAMPPLVNLMGLANSPDPARALGNTFPGPVAPTPELARQIVMLVQQNVPWAHLTPTFIANRVIFVVLGAALVLATLWVFDRQRRGR